MLDVDATMNMREYASVVAALSLRGEREELLTPEIMALYSDDV